MKKQTSRISAEDYGVALHTALRKCCDSKPTTIAWNVIYLMGKSWKQYLTYLNKTIPAGVKDRDLTEAVRRASLSWDCYDFEGSERHLAVILYCSFEMFTAGDWSAYTSFLEQ